MLAEVKAEPIKTTVLVAIVLIVTGFVCLTGVMIAICKSRGMCCFSNGNENDSQNTDPNAELEDRRERERLKLSRRLKNLEEKLIL